MEGIVKVLPNIVAKCEKNFLLFEDLKDHLTYELDSNILPKLVIQSIVPHLRIVSNNPVDQALVDRDEATRLLERL